MPEAFLDLISAFSNIFNARSILDGVSLSTEDSIGELIASPLLTIHDNPLHPSNISGIHFDGEGTPTQKLCLLNQGRITNFLHSEATARHFGSAPTGHAGLGAKVSVSPEWLEISRSSETKNKHEFSLNKEPSQYILVESLNALHAGVKSSQGSFSLPFDGWYINHGEKTSIEAATIAGDIKEVLMSIVEVEDSQVITHQGVSPHVWIKDLSITGEA